MSLSSLPKEPRTWLSSCPEFQFLDFTHLDLDHFTGEQKVSVTLWLFFFLFFWGGQSTLDYLNCKQTIDDLSGQSSFGSG